MTETCDVAVVGGGPVGLYMGLLLGQAGVDVRVLERRSAVSTHSRAVGLHPPALEAFDALGGLGHELAGAGVTIRRGVVRGPSGTLGELSFAGTSATHPYVLALPQQHTEARLEAALRARLPPVLQRGVEVTAVRERNGHVEIGVHAASGRSTLRARYVVGADGRRSAVRDAAGVPFPGRTYPMTYVMGDFPDTTTYAADAVITLSAGGVVESFPLPGGQRRWVAQTPALLAHARPSDLTALLAARTGLHVPAAECTMLSAFAVRRHLAPRFRSGRIVLAGDAAHEVSPIGGQGMNLGWLDAQDLAPRVVAALRGDTAALDGYTAARRPPAVRAARQAEVNMWLGRPLRGAEGRAREALMAGLLTSPLHTVLARAFTMRGL
ncbi:2-polyprenyl-6-methoxyphenol hydroxylase-like FAD-dependent oxidoreductase [Deinococcus metalli]|uniref:Oxidoreductase n=1 Tax=Deinococcus metalli TaxID=1141878 RepID=A0A7W8KD04_9DEIO|nr:NAD(P)/FAD-dependent oxidoreductase [Deinococcus metalli]MBB5375851.1 2-polyprenyl-6-methoxyphenol hydroxylase-like FAD-dependent oxidoreductase [Deinococcus metalli]GHF36560.1 oxidoreductase [Deinococcus metalli]